MHTTKRFRSLLPLFVVLFAGFVRAEAPAASPEATREAFLKIIDRPKVDPAPDVKLDSTEAGVAHYKFTYATQAEQRVPGIMLMKEQFAHDGKRHPVVIALHGTGGNKESQVGLLKRLAARDFIAIAI